MANKKYTIENYQEFCNAALTVPPLDDDNLNEWMENNKIHIIIGGNEIELEYFPETVTAVGSALKEIYNAVID